MSEGRQAGNRRAPRGVLRAVLLCAAAVLIAPQPGAAQAIGDQLRGEVAETDKDKDLLSTVPLAGQKTPLGEQTAPPPQDGNGIPVSTFEPTSKGATPDDDADTGPTKRKSIFTDTTDDQTDTQTDAARPGKPRTAQEREQARKKASLPADPVAVRLDADSKKKKDAAKKAAAAKEEADKAATTGTVRTKTIDSEEILKTDPDSKREDAIETLNKKPEENPYAPVGIRVGTFTVLPSAESGVTWTSNADSGPGGQPATLSETTLRLNAISEYDGNKTTIDAWGNFRKTISGEEIDQKRARIDAVHEHDLGRDWKALTSLGYEVGPESASSPTAVSGALEQPIEQTFTGSLGAEKELGKLQLRLTGNVERDVFGDAELSTGGSVSQSDQDSTFTAGVLRTGYEISPALTPFVELEYGHRNYDQEYDNNGYARSYDRTAARAGLAIDFGEKFKGEASAGWVNEDLQDPRLEPISGPTVAAAMEWSPVRGTIVGLDAETTLEDSTTPGASGSILYSGQVTLSHELRANLTAELALGGGVRDYTPSQDGRDTIWNAGAGLTWWLNRYVGLTGKGFHEQLTSTDPSRDYTTNSVFVGLKLQR
jgi:hypothetical protein